MQSYRHLKWTEVPIFNTSSPQTARIFSLELYLKCLILSDGVQPEYHHDLRDHFEKLSPKN